MKQVNSPSTILKWAGELVEVIGIANSKVIYMRPIGAKPCEKCGEIKTYNSIESSPEFQENAKPVQTSKEDITNE